jgi:hypothetical protein
LANAGGLTGKMGNSSSSKLSTSVFSGSLSVPVHENKFKILIIGDSFVGM